MPTSNITLIIRKIFDDYDEKNGAQQKTDYTQRAQKIVQTWTQSMAKEGLTTQLICELHRLVCEDEWIPINDPKGGIAGFAKSGEYRTTPSSAPSELKKDARRLFIPPNDIVLKMEQLVATMNNILATKLPKDTMVENILAFLVELSTIHPFPNQNWRVILSLVELLAYQTKLEPFCISYINKVNPKLLIRSVEETILYQTVQPLLTIISRYKNEQHISIDDNEGIGSFFGYTKRQNPDEILHKTIHSLFPPLQTKRVLDAGCGSGTYTKYFIENGASVVGIDASNLAISRAKQTIIGEVSFLLGNLEQPLSYLENESFDFIFSNLVIHYVLDWDRLFRDFFRILKFGGSAIIVVPHPNRNVLNDYFAVEKVSEVFYTETANINIEYYRRPFQMMLNPMNQAGFQIKNTIEFNQEANEQTSVLFLITKNAALTTAKTHMEHTLDIAKYAFNTGDFPVGSNCINTTQTIDEASITLIIRKIFDDYDEKNGAQQKTDYTQRAKKIVQTWTQSMAKEGLTTKLLCELHRLVCNNEAIAIHDEQGNILGYTDAGAYRTHPSSRKSELRVGARRLFLPPEVIASKLEQLVSIMNTVLATKLSQEQMIENVLSFAVEFSTIHPFANQNGRMMQLLMELIAYQVGIKPFRISKVNKLNSNQLTRAVEETILYQTVQPLKTIISRYKSEQNISNIKIDDSESIGNYFAHSQSVSPNVILQDTELGLFLPTLKDKKILDAGCGIGTYAKYFVENGATVIGIDASQAAIDKAKQMSLEQATFMVGDLEKPLDSFDNESFDFIFSYLVIHYIEDWDRLFKDFFRMLKIGGSILFAVSHPSKNVVSDYFSVEKTTETFYRNGQTISIEYYRRPLQNMLNTMINAGFQLDKTIEFKHKVVDRFYIAFRLYKHTSGLPSDTTMEQALAMAKQAFDAGDFPVGSVMVSNGEVLSKARNEIFTKNNYYHHAEINLIAKSLSYQNVEHKVVYVTLEPCWRCAQALVDFGVKEVFYILEDPLGGGAETLKKSNVKMTKLGEYEKEYTELLLTYFTNNPHLPQQITQYQALYEHVKNNINKEKTNA